MWKAGQRVRFNLKTGLVSKADLEIVSKCSVQFMGKTRALMWPSLRKS